MENIVKNQNIVALIVVIISIKIFAACIFSSSFSNEMFIPFITEFINGEKNPWQFFYNKGTNFYDVFPYPPLMLYIYSSFYYFYNIFNFDNIFLSNFFFKIPTFLSDLLILWVLFKLSSGHKLRAVLLYFASPIIIYAAYIHSQLDLLPTALLIFSCYLLTINRFSYSALVLGLSLATKFHIILALPLFAIYFYKKKNFSALAIFATIPLLTYLTISYPYIFSEGYQKLVLFNNRQSALYNSFFSVGEIKVYIPVLLSVLVYLFLLYSKKINNDLFFAIIAILFSLIVIFVYPSPGWYLWIIPFICRIFIKSFLDRKIICLKLGLDFFYLGYFVFFHISGHNDLIFIDKPVDLIIDNKIMINMMFTLLEATLIFTVIYITKISILSNSLYKRDYALTIGIGGDSGSGKTSLLDSIKNLLGKKALELEGDGDHKWERGDQNWKQHTHLDPRANFLHSQAENIESLKHGRVIYRKEYDHNTGKFTSEKKISPKDFIIMAGLHPFYLPKMRKLFDIKIFMDLDENLRRHWKIIRDTNNRGYSKESVSKQIETREKDGSKYIKPQKEYADIIFRKYTEDNFEIGNPGNNPNLKMLVSLDASIDLDKFYQNLKLLNTLSFSYDYSDDLKNQNIIFQGNITPDEIQKIAYEIIDNIEELLSENIVWQENYHGIQQIITLLVISYKLKNV